MIPATWAHPSAAMKRPCSKCLQRALPLTVLQHRRDWLLVQQVRQALGNPAVASHNAETLAAAPNMSPRPLHRQLQDEGASLRRLKDEVRSKKAKDLLLRTSKSIKQVAAASRFRNERVLFGRFWSGLGHRPTSFVTAKKSKTAFLNKRHNVVF